MLGGNKGLNGYIIDGDIEGVKKALQDGADPNFMVNGNSALIEAIKLGRVDILQKLLLNGANVHLADADGKTAREYTAESHNKEIVNLFNAYEAVEKDFKDKFVPAVKDKMLSEGHFAVGSSVQDVTDGYLMAMFTSAAKEVYGAGSMGALTENVDGKVQFKEQFKLHFVVEFFTITLPALFESVVGDLNFNQLRVEKLSEAIYSKIQDSPEFQKLAAPVVGRATDVVVGAIAGKPEDALEKVKEGFKGITGKPVLGEHTKKYIESQTQKGGVSGRGAG